MNELAKQSKGMSEDGNLLLTNVEQKYFLFSKFFFII